MTTRVQVRDSASNVFAFHDCSTTEEAIAFSATFIADGFRVEIVPVVPTPTVARLGYLEDRPIEDVLGFER